MGVSLNALTLAHIGHWVLQSLVRPQFSRNPQHGTRLIPTPSLIAYQNCLKSDISNQSKMQTMSFNNILELKYFSGFHIISALLLFVLATSSIKAQAVIPVGSS